MEEPAAPETSPLLSPQWAGWKYFPEETCGLLGITVPFVLILVDISFHTLLNEPLQKDETEICFRREKNDVCFRTKQAYDLVF